MKKVLLVTYAILSFGLANAQNGFSEQSDVIAYMEGKSFYNRDLGLTIELAYISSYNTYGIILSNSNGANSYFINVDITTYGAFADLYGMSADDGKNFGFRLYKGKLIVGRGEVGETTYYLK
jgi:hypothetical protein